MASAQGPRGKLAQMLEFFRRPREVARKTESDVRHIFSGLPLGGTGGTAGSGAHPPTILVVEDDEATRLAMGSWLTGEGFVVLSAESGYEAIRHLLHPLEPIDLVLLDVGLPDVNGAILHETIKELCPFLPVVVCTGQATTEEAARMLELGARRYLRKPVDPEELVSAVEEALP
jgi:CheY-like chemotaxis protein